MSVYPGSNPPVFSSLATFANTGYQETLLQFQSHNGTHMDAPGHVIEGAPFLDQLPVDRFCGSAVVIDCTDLGVGDWITMKHIRAAGEAAMSADFILLRTGWSKYWGAESYLDDFPAIDEEVAQFLVDTGKKGVGMDTISVDRITVEELGIHKKLLSRGVLIVENLHNLDKIQGPCRFFALPLHYDNADGAAVRAIAEVAQTP